MTRLPRPVGVAAVVLAAATMSGCSFTTQQTTDMYYQPADGVEALLGPDVTVSSVLLVAEGADAPGSLVARIVNDGTEPASVQLVGADVGVQVDVTVPPGQTLAIGPDGDEEVVVDRVGAVPGTLVPMTAVLGDGEVVQELRVPVMDGTFERFAELLPTSGPTSGPTGSPTATP